MLAKQKTEMGFTAQSKSLALIGVVSCVCLADCPLQLRELCILYSRDIFIACLRVAQSVST